MTIMDVATPAVRQFRACGCGEFTDQDACGPCRVSEVPPMPPTAITVYVGCGHRVENGCGGCMAEVS